MNIVFIGSTRFGARVLDTLATIDSCILVGAITSDQVFKISYSPAGVHNVLHADIRNRCHFLGIPALTLTSNMNDPMLMSEVASWSPEAFVVAGWYHMVPRAWRNIAPVYGLHASLLPDYSGGAPLVWAIINGERETGITLFQLADGVDNGPIVGQLATEIRDDDTIDSLYARIEELGLRLVNEHLPRLASGSAELVEQDERRRRRFPQRTPEDGLIDWNKDATYIDRFIRAQTRPYPGAFTTLNGKPLHIWRASVVREVNDCDEAGQVSWNGSNAYIVCCGVGAIQIDEISYDNQNYSNTQVVENLNLAGQRLGM